MLFRPRLKVSESWSVRRRLAVAELRSWAITTWLKFFGLYVGSLVLLGLLIAFRHQVPLTSALRGALLPATVIGIPIAGLNLAFMLIPREWRFYESKLAVWGGPQVQRISYSHLQSVQVAEKCDVGRDLKVLQLVSDNGKVVAELVVQASSIPGELQGFLIGKSILWRPAV